MRIKNLFARNKNKAADSNMIGLGQLVWLGFNYTCSVGFAYTLSSTYGGSQGVGLNLIWIIILGALIAGGTGWAFAKCSQVYSDENGGAFEYSKKTFGRFSGWMVGFYQYVLVPVTTPASILVLLTVSLQGLYSTDMWGKYTDMYLNLIAVGIYIVLSLFVLMGTKTFKWGTNVASVLKWMVLGLVYIGAIIIMVRTSGANFSKALHTGNLNGTNFNNAFSTFFYAYTGFETFAVIGKNVKEPKKTMPKAIMLVLLSAVLFYIVGLIFIVGALSGTMPANPNNAIIQLAMGSVALTLVAIANLASNVNGFMQGAYYSGGMLQPLSDNYMITKKISKINPKNQIAVRALVVNLVLTVFFSIIWLVLPYLLNQPTFNYSSLVGFNSIVMFIVYGTVLAAAIFLKIKKKIKASIYEVIIWLLVILFLIYQFVEYFMQWDSNKWQILTFAVVSLLAVIWYFVYCRRVWKKLLAKNLVKDISYRDLKDVEQNSRTIKNKKRKINKLDLK